MVCVVGDCKVRDKVFNSGAGLWVVYVGGCVIAIRAQVAWVGLQYCARGVNGGKWIEEADALVGLKGVGIKFKVV